MKATGSTVARRLALVFLGPFLAASMAACKPAARSAVVVYTSVDQVFAEPVLRRFDQQTGVEVRAVFDTEETKSTGVLNRLIAEAGNPRADVFWSGDPVRPYQLVKRGLVAAYRPPAADGLPDLARAPDGTWTGFAARARVLLVNTTLVDAAAMPRRLADLTDPRWRDRVAIANPLFGTTTMHVAALVTVWGEAQTRELLRGLEENGVRVASSNGEVRRLVVAGEVAVGLTDTDDANEALKAGAPVAVIYPDQDSVGTLVMPTAAVIVKGGPNPEAARRLVDYLVSAPVEEQMAMSAAHMPLRPGVRAPDGVPMVGAIRAMQVDYAAVAGAMERIQPWLRDWVRL
jgi:iron(III) transport system substrate-binding protein